jgi:hypothetical protein
MRNLYLPLTVALLAWSTTDVGAQAYKPQPVKPVARPATFAPSVHQRAVRSESDRGGIANDGCAGAITLNVGASCAPQSLTSTGATESQAAILCNGFTSPEANDVWFTFTANGPVTTVEVSGVDDFDAVMEAFTGTCGTLQSIGCMDATFPPNSTLEVFPIATVAGQTYYVRLYSYWSPVPVSSSFTICAYAPAGVPANDQCNAVTPVSLAVGGSVNFTGDNTGALDTEGLGFASVWHAFTTTECTSLTLNYCGTSPAFENAFLNLFTGCPLDGFVESASFDVTSCPDGNVTIFYEYVPAGTYYYAVLTEPGAQGPYSITVSATACPPGYCDAFGTTCDEFIANVAFGSINNASDCADGALVDYTAISTTVAQGSVVSMTVLNGPNIYAEDQVVAWFDWNQNESFFDAGESYTLTSANGGATFTGNIAVPAGATLGSTRMRVRMLYTGTPSPCGPAEYGEVEDYTVVVTAGGGAPANDNCTGAVPEALSTGSTITLSGNNTGATVDAPTEFVIVWEAFTITECANIDIGYCVPDSEFDDFLINLTTGCPDFITGLLTGSVSTDQCTVSFTEIPAGTYYIPVLVDPASTPIGDYSLTVTATACPVGVYCSASATNATFELIGNVAFADIDNATTAAIGYEDQTAVVATVTAGVDYPLTVTIDGGFAEDQVLVWIDFDQSNSFEPSELVLTSAIGVGPHSGTVSIPLTATAGNTRMRIRLHDTHDGSEYPNTPNTTPCGTSTYGQVEDYTVFVQGIITGVTANEALAFTVFPNPGNGDMTIGTGSIEGLVQFEVMDMTGRLVHGEQFPVSAGAQVQLNLAGKLAAGTYVLRLSSEQGRTEQRIVVR